MSQRIGVFGGTFDPPHLGHLIVVQEVLEQLSLDRVLLIPAGLPPHKMDRSLTDGAIRGEMVAAAVAGHPELEVRDLELQRTGASYTVDTLEALRTEYPDASLFLIMGVDQWRGFAGWKLPTRIRELAKIVVMNRGGEGSDEGFETGGMAFEGGPPMGVTVPSIALSSTGIRARVRAGRSIRFLVPEEVRRIIQEAKLYL
jgi:nicotinate-nucleotide adenylyltransferase